MSYVIVQSPEQTKLSFSLQSKADIDAVRLVEATIRCKSKFEDVKHPLAFAVEFEPGDARVEGRYLTVGVRFAFRISDKDKTDVISLTCFVNVDYQLAVL